MRIIDKQCFIFDLDGTLIDSSGLHEKAFRDVISRYAPELAEVFDYGAQKGKSTEEVFRSLGVADKERLADLTKKKRIEYRRRIAPECKPFANTFGLLTQLQAMGRRLFIVTGSSDNSARRGLETTCLIGFFEGMVTADDVTKHKPDPEPFLYCVRHYKLSPDSCVVVEDAVSGVESAQAAGLDVVGVHNPQLETLGISVFSNFYDMGHALDHYNDEAARK